LRLRPQFGGDFLLVPRLLTVRREIPWRGKEPNDSDIHDLFSYIRGEIRGIKDRWPELASAALHDVGFLRTGERLVIKMYFQLPDPAGTGCDGETDDCLLSEVDPSAADDTAAAAERGFDTNPGGVNLWEELFREKGASIHGSERLQ